MFEITKTIEVAGSHKLTLPYKSKCSQYHGHNWIVDVTIISEELNSSGMVVDFTHIKNIVMQLDHVCLNDIISINPTAENIAIWLTEEIERLLEKETNKPTVRSITIQESEGNVICYIP